MEMSFAKELKESGIFEGLVLPGGFDLALRGRSYSRMEAWCPAWILPKLRCRHLAFQPQTCAVFTLVGHQWQQGPGCPSSWSLEAGWSDMVSLQQMLPFRSFRLD